MFPDNRDRENVYYVNQPPKQDSLLDGFIVPALQALFGGLLFGLCTGGIVALAKVQVNPWAAGALAGCLFTLGNFLVFRERWSWRLERILGVDLNGDNVIGRPAPPETVRIEMIENGGQDVQFIDLPSADKLPALASGLLQGRQFSQAVWTGGGQLFSRGEFEALRAELLRRGLAAYRNPQAPAQGLVLTAAGRAIFKRLANKPLPQDAAAASRYPAACVCVCA